MYWDKAWPTAAKPVFCPRWGVMLGSSVHAVAGAVGLGGDYCRIADTVYRD
ncbi:hypothetical protein P4W15_03375 [Morganella morganii]|nr:hypothetical protein [Morganella morganii]